ncbi:MAG: sulfatase-like hydrolase/transferase, partial [Planctomycetaceae bacterium]|nr:sulfatase-like hydrolase/transferase [Planctomycetaceae bacterium]
MKRLRNLLCVLLVAIGMVGVESIEASANESNSPNVLFIAVDDLNDWVGYLGGHPQGYTPNIDNLADEGVAFTHAYCPAPVCGPSRTALMYGVFPHRSGSYGHDEIYNAGKII